MEKSFSLNSSTEFLVTGFTIPPWAYVTGDQEKPFTGGIVRDLFYYMWKPFNPRFVYVPPVSKSYGDVSPNGSWSGMLGMLHQGSADLLCGPGGLDFTRSQYIGYTFPYYQTDLVIVSGKPDNYSYNPFSYLLIFDENVWVFIILTFAILAAVLWCSEAIDFGHKRQKFSSLIWYFFGLMCFEFSPWIPSRGTSRLLFALWLMMVLVMMHTFGSSMIAHLTAKKKPHRIENLDDILKRPNIQPLVLEKTLLQNFFQDSQEELKKRIWSQVIRTGGLKPIFEMYSKPYLDRVNNGQAIMFSDPLMMKLSLKRYCHNRKYYFSRNGIFRTYMTYLVNKKIPKDVMEIVNHRILLYSSGGHMDHVIDETFIELEKCLSVPKVIPVEKSLTVENLIPAFIIWGIVGSVASMVLVTEIVYSSLKK